MEKIGSTRITTIKNLKPSGIGSSTRIVVHQYSPQIPTPVENKKSIYIQASLHADELPGMLVSHHLIKLLDKAAHRGLIKNDITIVPYANPIGLGQNVLGNHIGRFSTSSGINFNRDWIDVTQTVIKKLSELNILSDDPKHNVRTIRELMADEINSLSFNKEDAQLKKELFLMAAPADIVLDLHCDADAVMHMYTHTRLWPHMSDLAEEIQSRCHLLAPWSGGNPFDESCSCPWAEFADVFAAHPIPMACQAVTVELRGESEVNDSLALKDSKALYRFLARRGFVAEDSEMSAIVSESSNQSFVLPDATPLSGVDMIEAVAPGVLAWKVGPGSIVSQGDVLGEIVNIEDVDAPRIPIVSNASGIVFGMRRHKLARPGDIIIKVSGPTPLEWRKGNLLTSK
eukprot:gene12539-16817_t